MEPSCAHDGRVRLLGLGNELLADDAFGILAAREAERRLAGRIPVVTSSASGFRLLDDLLDADRLIVLDSIQTGRVPPGSVMVFRGEELQPVPGGSPHCAGILEALTAARALGLPAPREVVIVAVEAADCATVGGALHEDVRRSIAGAVDLAVRYAEGVSYG